MSEVAMENPTSNPMELLATGRRHLIVKDFNSAVETLASACELLAKEHGEAADPCAEAYYWYGKSLLGLSRVESGVLGDGVPGADNDDEEEDDEENGENGDEQNEDANEPMEQNEAETTAKNGDADEKAASPEKPELDTNEEPSTTKPDAEDEETAEDVPENGDPKDESTVNMEDDDVDNLQLAWEMLDLARSILYRRVQDGGGDKARALLADVHLSLGEVALESETYDKAVVDMQSCLDLQKELYRNDDRRIAETHYQIGLANSLASNFEDAITHFKNAANILESRIQTLESPTANDDATVKKYLSSDSKYSVEKEIKELKELLPEIQEKIQDMMEYKAETVKKVREALQGVGDVLGAVGSSSVGFSSSSGDSAATGFSSASSAGASSSKPAANISHLIKRKRKTSEEDKDAAPVAKKANT